MKKLLLTFFFFLTLLTSLWAQETIHGLGLRFGATYGMGTEITYLHKISNANRFEVDFGYNSRYAYKDIRYSYNSWAVIGLYHWVWNLRDNLNWYAGPGAQIGKWNSLIYNSDYDNGLFLSVAGDLGVEYLFPEYNLQVSLDIRPELGYNRGFGINTGFAVRYLF